MCQTNASRLHILIKLLIDKGSIRRKKGKEGMNSARESATRGGRTYMLTRCSCVNDYLTDTLTDITSTFDTNVIFARNSVFRRREAASARVEINRAVD